MNGIYAFTVTRAATPERARLLQETITSARKTAGCEFEWNVWASGCSDVGKEVLSAAMNTGQIDRPWYCPDNVGQHLAWNEAYKQAVDGDYKYFLRIDDDCEFLTKRWLKKLVDASEELEDTMILSPVVRGLNHPPQTSNPVTHNGISLRFLREAIGGICRLHPMRVLKKHEFIADVRKPLGSGDATGIGGWCKDNVIPMAYLQFARVRHAKSTDDQIKNDPNHFLHHGVFQHIPYIPRYERNT